MYHHSLPHSLSLLEKLKHTASQHDPGHVNALLIVRHAERPYIGAGEGLGFEMGITDEAKEEAKIFGQLIATSGLKPGTLISSPFVRCLESLQVIVEAAGWDIEMIEPNLELVGVNTFYAEPRTAGGVISTIGPIAATNKNIAGEIPDGYLPFEEGTGKFLDFVKAHLDNNAKKAAENKSGYVDILLGHDTTLAPVIAKCFGVSEFTDENWPGFLETLMIVRKKSGDGHVDEIHWREKVASFH